MKYIGNKMRVLSFIQNSLEKSSIDYKNKYILDLFSGTGSVSGFFLQNGCIVESVDNLLFCVYYQFFRYKKINWNLISTGNKIIDKLNSSDLLEGYIFDNFAPGGLNNRQYFSDKNAKKIDGVLYNFKKLELNNELKEIIFGNILNSIDRVSNTSGTYGAYLKIWRGMALKNFEIPYLSSCNKYENFYLFNDDVVNFLIKSDKKYDIVYLDPPYNNRQYASNYHLLENIATLENNLVKGKTGVFTNSVFKFSKMSYVSTVKSEFESIISLINSKYIIFSYSTEGIMSKEIILGILSKKGEVEIYEYEYRRFKTNSKTKKDTNLKELLFICKVY